jgi:small-conductance mechanosensitive channel
VARVHVWVEARQRLETARAELEGLAEAILQEREALNELTKQLLTVLQRVEAADSPATMAAWRDELEAIAAALAGRVSTLHLRA